MKQIILSLTLFVGMAAGGEPKTKSLVALGNDIYLKTPVLIKEQFGNPFEVEMIQGTSQEDGIDRMMWYYKTPNASEVVGLLFEFVPDMRSVREDLRSAVRAGKYHLIAVIYRPHYFHFAPAQVAQK